MGTHLLSLPVEIRLHIYSYLHKPRLHLDFCKDVAETRLPSSIASRRASPLLSYLNKRKAESQWARDHGLHLLATSSTLRQEFTDLLDRAETSLVVHCVDCLAKLLHHLIRDLGIRQPVFKNIWLKVDFNCSPSQYTTGHWTLHLENVIADFQTHMQSLYGHFDLLGTELTPIGLKQVWSVEVIRTIGLRAIQKDSLYPTQNMIPSTVGDNDDDDDESDEEDGHALGSAVWSYQSLPRVKELGRQVKRLDVARFADPDSRQRDHLTRALHRTLPALSADHWRLPDEALRREHKAAGKSVRRLVMREEVWVGVRMGL